MDLDAVTPRAPSFPFGVNYIRWTDSHGKNHTFVKDLGTRQKEVVVTASMSSLLTRLLIFDRTRCRLACLVLRRTLIFGLTNDRKCRVK